MRDRKIKSTKPVREEANRARSWREGSGQESVCVCVNGGEGEEIKKQDMNRGIKRERGAYAVKRAH